MASISFKIFNTTVWRRSCDGVNVYQRRTRATPVFTCGDTTPCSQAEFVGFYQCIGGYQWSIISIIIDLLHNHSYHLLLWCSCCLPLHIISQNNLFTNFTFQKREIFAMAPPCDVKTEVAQVLLWYTLTPSHDLLQTVFFCLRGTVNMHMITLAFIFCFIGTCFSAGVLFACCFSSHSSPSSFPNSCISYRSST